MSQKYKFRPSRTSSITPYAPQEDEKRTIIRLPEVIRRTGLGRSSLYEAIKRGEFPNKFALGARAVGWDSLAVQSWIDAKVNASNTHTCDSEVSITALAAVKGKSQTIKKSSDVLLEEISVKTAVHPETRLDDAKIGGAA